VRLTVLLLLARIAAATTPTAAQHLAPSPFARFDAALPPTAATAGPATPRSADAGHAAAHAASRAAARTAAGHAPNSDRRPDTAALALAGLIGGGVGLYLGGLIGTRLQGTPCEDCYFAPFVGAVMGESLAIPLAVHLADGRRGQAAPGMVASLAIAAGGLVAAGALHRAEVLLAVPVLQIAAAVASQRHTAGPAPN
jgi:hypothetical protein